MSKIDALDLMKLYSKGSTNGWNEYLNKCFIDKNINSLARMRYAAQVGMDNLSKSKLNTDEINIWFCRLIKSIEITAKKIIRSKHPLPIDNPLSPKESNYFEQRKIKTLRDRELAKFFKDSSY